MRLVVFSYAEKSALEWSREASCYSPIFWFDVGHSGIIWAVPCVLGSGFTLQRSPGNEISGVFGYGS